MQTDKRRLFHKKDRRQFWLVMMPSFFILLNRKLKEPEKSVLMCCLETQTAWLNYSFSEVKFWDWKILVFFNLIIIRLNQNTFFQFQEKSREWSGWFTSLTFWFICVRYIQPLAAAWSEMVSLAAGIIHSIDANPIIKKSSIGCTLWQL